MVRTILLVSMLLAGCDGDSSKSDTKAADDAKAKQAEQDAALAKRKAEREAKAKQQEDAKAALDAKLDELAVLPDKLPGKLDQACKAMTSAYDAYMRTVLKGDDLTKWETGGNDMGIKLFDRDCKKKGSIPIAACQAEALAKMSPDMDKQVGQMMQRCAAKFADDDDAAG